MTKSELKIKQLILYNKSDLLYILKIELDNWKINKRAEKFERHCKSKKLQREGHN